MNFGVAVGSDAGVFGELSLEQRNFDISDWPESLDELLSGRAFRGAGQHFNMAIRPGTELFQYIASWTDPRLFDSDYSLTVSGQYRSRFYDLYDEDRVGTSVALGRRFGDIWTGSVRTRLERVELANIEDDAPTAIFDDAGPNTITALGLSLTRTTISTVRRPGSGSRLELAIDRFGALGGDVDFTSVSADYTVFLTLNEDFLGRKSTLKLSTRAASIFDGDAPVYESLYLGGRTLRGFDFRTVSPKGVRFTDGTPPVLVPSDEPIGGDWLFFAGAQYEVPVWEDNLTFVLFCDSGTVLNDPGFEDYRVSLGAGLRIYIPQFGDIPIALDFAFPVLKEETDEEQFFSFSAELPF